jgi:hypothetical protein
MSITNFFIFPTKCIIFLLIFFLNTAQSQSNALNIVPNANYQNNGGSFNISVRETSMNFAGSAIAAMEITDIRLDSDLRGSDHQLGDVIYAIDYSVFLTFQQMAAYVRSLRQGSQITIHYMRPGNNSPHFVRSFTLNNIENSAELLRASRRIRRNILADTPDINWAIRRGCLSNSQVLSESNSLVSVLTPWLQSDDILPSNLVASVRRLITVRLELADEISRRCRGR